MNRSCARAAQQDPMCEAQLIIMANPQNRDPLSHQNVERGCSSGRLSVHVNRDETTQLKRHSWPRVAAFLKDAVQSVTQLASEDFSSCGFFALNIDHGWQNAEGAKKIKVTDANVNCGPSMLWIDVAYFGW